MQLSQMNWMQVEAYLQKDDRVVIPLGSTEQHAYLSLSTDSILAERVALEAAQDPGVVVYPVLPFGIAPYFGAFPGSVSLRMASYLLLIEDLLESVRKSGFRRVLFVNGHGGNIPAATFVIEWMAQHEEMRIKWHNWWAGVETMKVVHEIDPVASHASWMENFPWTRLPGVEMPAEQSLPEDVSTQARKTGTAMREWVGAGNFGGYYQRSDDEMMRVWQAGVTETRALIEGTW